MKISIGSKIIAGPFGGGNEFLKNLKNHFEDKNYKVVNNLDDDDIDIILLTNPLIDSETSTFNNYDVDFYINFVNPSAIVIQRINECDERKGTKNLNYTISKLNKNVDLNIFVSKWLKSIYKNYDLYTKPSYVIKGGPNEKIFNTINKIKWDGIEKIKIVTHHWSDNLMKGFEDYKKLDTLIAEGLNEYLEFTIIGNIPKNLSFPNSKILNPLTGQDLSNELKKHHIYITASVNEPSGNHHMEGALCGLPILYIDSGALPEYCKNYGVMFNIDNFVYYLNKIKKEYKNLCKNLENYPYTFTNTAEIYEKIFLESIKNKKDIYKKRKKTFKAQVIINLVINKLILFIHNQTMRGKIFLGNIKKELKNVN